MAYSRIEKAINSIRGVECKGYNDIVTILTRMAGLNGHIIVSDDSAEESILYSIEALSGSAEISYSVEVGGEYVSVTNQNLNQGDSVRGKITDLVVTSGEVVAYYF